MANAFTTKQTDIGTREYILQLTGEFDSTTQESALKSSAVSSVKNLNWAINSNGYIKLIWEGTTVPNDVVFAIISGNGRWDLGRAEFKKPTANTTGKIKLVTVGFEAIDSYSIILNGAV